MRLTYLLLAALAAASYSTAQAQITRGGTARSDLEVISQQLGGGKGMKSVGEATGTPLLLPYWTQGRVLTINGPVGPVWLKYNLVSGELLWRRPAGDSLEVNTAQVKEFTLGDSLRGNRATFRRYLAARMEEPALRTTFFEVCYDAGRSALLRQRTKQLAYATSAGPSLTESRPPAWQASAQYFVKRTDNTILPVRLTEKAVLEALGPAQMPALAAYAKHEHLALKKESDVAKLLAYYDTL